MPFRQPLIGLVIVAVAAFLAAAPGARGHAQTLR